MSGSSAANESDPAALGTSQTDAPGLESPENLTERFNIFEVIGLEKWETVHSRFLAFLLDPKQSHGLGNSFLAGLLRRISEATPAVPLPRVNDDADDRGLGRTTSHTEVYTDDGRIDILLLNEVGQWAVIIENKIGTTEHSDQLDRYLRFVKENYPDREVICVYLTPHGYKSSHEAYHPLSYEMICEITDSTLEELGSTLSPDVRISMEHYVRMVRKHVVGDPTAASKGSFTLDELYARAEQQGNGKAFTIIRDAAERHGLYPRTYPWSVMYTPPTKRNRALVTVGIYDKAGRGLNLWVSLEAWTEFYDVSKERVEYIFGREQEIEDVTLTLAKEFAARLDQLFASIKTQDSN